MHRWGWYATGVYLVPSKLTSAILTGLLIAYIVYTVQISILEMAPLVALGTATLAFKTATTVSYLLG